MKDKLKFIYIFLIIGLESFGNMSAVTFILENILIKKYKLVTQEDILDALTLSRLGPGATTANMVVFLGNKIAGFLGGVIATICYTIAPLIVIIIIYNFFINTLDYPFIVSGMKGGLVFISVMIINSSFEMIKKILTDKFNIIIFCVILLLSISINISYFWFIIIAILLRSYKKFIFSKFQNII